MTDRITVRVEHAIGMPQYHQVNEVTLGRTAPPRRWRNWYRLVAGRAFDRVLGQSVKAPHDHAFQNEPLWPSKEVAEERGLGYESLWNERWDYTGSKIKYLFTEPVDDD